MPVVGEFYRWYYTLPTGGCGPVGVARNAIGVARRLRAPKDSIPGVKEFDPWYQLHFEMKKP